jgi:NTP pyrophosphatase (non-canonical NTP hydrolase)
LANDTLECLRARAATWAETRLGRECLYNFVERSRKGIEEAAELAQAVGLDEATALRIVMYVYSRPVGVIKQELAGCFMTVLLTATALGYDLEQIMTEELDRVIALTPDSGILLAKQAEKFKAGISAYGG